MRKRDCAFLLTYRHANATYQMTSKNQRMGYFSLRALTPMQMSRKISKVTGPKFTKFVAVVIFSPTVLTQQSALRSAHPLPNERGDI